MIKKDELKLLKELCEKATPGPWKSYVEGRNCESGSSFIQTNGGEDIELSGATDYDQDFIAAAREALPKLLLLITENSQNHRSKLESEEYLNFGAYSVLP